MSQFGLSKLYEIEQNLKQHMPSFEDLVKWKSTQRDLLHLQKETGVIEEEEEQLIEVEAACKNISLPRKRKK